MTADRTINTRVLVIDDDPAVRDSFRTALRPRARPDAGVRSAAQVLFGEHAREPRADASLTFELDVAPDGESGVAMARAAFETGRPYALVFCDMRMPGLDGIETIERIRAFDRRAEVVFVTAYSDHSIEDIVHRTGANVGYFVKPFVADEMRQLATKLVVEWNKAREIESLVRAVATLRGEPHNMRRLVEHLLREICLWLETDSAAVLRRTAEGDFAFDVGVGRLHAQEAVRAVTDRLNGTLRSQADGAEAAQLEADSEGTFVLPIHQYGVAIALTRGARITPDRRYLLEVFLENAALALRNCEIAARLGEVERLAAAGRALGFILHDVRNPLGAASMVTKALRLAPPDAAETQRGLAKIEFELQRAIELIRDTLALCSGRLEVRPGPLDAQAFLCDPDASWRMLLALRRVRIETDAPSGITLYADPARLARALYNLTKNAADAIAGVPDGFVEVGVRRVEDGVELWVADNGEGVPEAVLPSLFQPFATMGKEDGTGFGLAIVRQVVEAHGGTVRHTRTDGRTRFSLRLPDAPQ